VVSYSCFFKFKYILNYFSDETSTICMRHLNDNYDFRMSGTNVMSPIITVVLLDARENKLKNSKVY